MYSVYQHWDTLKTCIVGQTYPIEFFSFIKNSKTRTAFENMVQETEEDYQKLIKLLNQKFDVKILRPEFPSDFDSLYIDGKWVQPPTAPRDYFIMIEDKFWVPQVPNASHAWSVFYRQIKESSWPNFDRPSDFYRAMPDHVADVKEKFFKFNQVDQQHLYGKFSFYQHIFNDIQNAGNEIVYTDLDFINGCFVSRLGRDLYFATQTYHDNKQEILNKVNKEFPNTRNHVV